MSGAILLLNRVLRIFFFNGFYFRIKSALSFKAKKRLVENTFVCGDVFNVHDLSHHHNLLRWALFIMVNCGLQKNLRLTLITVFYMLMLDGFHCQKPD